MTSLSIILVVFVLQLHHVGPHQRPVPRWLRFICVEILARIMCMRTSQIPASYSKNFRKDDMCLTTFFENVDGNNCNGSLPQNALKYHDKIIDVERDNTHRRITKHLKVLVEKQDFEDHHQDIVNEWRFVALVMDRILFWVFLCASLISSIMILVVEPMRKPPVWSTLMIFFVKYSQMHYYKVCTEIAVYTILLIAYLFRGVHCIMGGSGTFYIHAERCACVNGN